MEGIAKIKATILEEAQEEKQKLLENARAQARDIRAKYENKAEEILNDILEKANRAAEEKKRRILSMAQLENRKALLQAKQQIIDEVFEKAKAKLKNMSDEDYSNLIAEMLLKSVVTGNEEVVISEDDKNRITPDFIKKINEKLKSMGKQGNLRISETPGKMIGGFILKSEDMEINCTFDSLINMEREELETEIAKILFEE
ncbi:V-type proton ATPase subunit E [Tepidanaerobacter acetatoxydans Re1]|uniref:V-type proton ATPase subunit E n=1 Tax=Tepidanaerobacter acetatoxydans (strain DSM 21804 / JCM 16047 / Re1) TaxID=1209989 RepID=F4LR53_TEPAE|nr:V-type ATP synthase subunit E family protein [Tepidanaerobacter acetatoxydans]AEE92206.1 V-type proton ATPase subunit E [Tepidanaerobacter acetatoxydans Re1]CCP27076.1 V-type proton ATPase subunit E [Tepidanaerobacter acetatoxydans Re1]